MALHAGKRVRYWREIQGLTQLDLATKSKMDNTKLCRIEKGEQEARASELEQLVEAMGLTMAEFYGELAEAS